MPNTVPARFFNTTGPVRSDDHYTIPPLERLDLNHIRQLLREQRYFVLYAPRQTGKTSILLALHDLLNSEGDYRCVYINVELAQMARDNVADAMRAILSMLATRASITLHDDSFATLWPDILTRAGPNGALWEALTYWCRADSKPLILLIDEIDALVGDSLISILRQLRTGYPGRPHSFPSSVILCGVRDVRDYRIHSKSQNEIVAGGSAFNIKAASLRVGDFSEDEVKRLLNQHTQETGQSFTTAAMETVWHQSEGQPWLVNALAYEVCFRNLPDQVDQTSIDAEQIYQAREQLIERREVHLDQLADKLQEDRVRRIIEPLLSGNDESEFSSRDLEYVRDLGLIANAGPLRIANPIYAEVVPRELTYATQTGLVQDTAWYVNPDGNLNTTKLLAAFQNFFREHSEHWVARFDYQEAGPQLLLQAFLQRVVNGGGRIEREYGLGRGRTDLLIIWPQGEVTRRFVVECKLVHKGLESTIREGLKQTYNYLDRSAAEAGHLVIFNCSKDLSWKEKIFRRQESIDDHRITVWGM